MGKVAMVVGHTENKQGACSPFKDKLPSEFVFNSGIAEGTKCDSIDVYYYDPSIIGYSARVDKLAEEINKIDYEAVIELHYNGSSSPQAHGTEALFYFNSKKGKKYAYLFCQLFCQVFMTKNRFEKGLYNRKQRGYYFLKRMKAPAIILEPIFGSSEEDVNLLHGLSDKYSEFLKYFISNYILK